MRKTQIINNSDLSFFILSIMKNMQKKSMCNSKILMAVLDLLFYFMYLKINYAKVTIKCRQMI